MSKDKTKAAAFNFKTQIKEIERYNLKTEETLNSKNIRAITLLKSNIQSALDKLDDSYFKYGVCEDFNEEVEYEHFSAAKSLAEDLIVKTETILNQLESKPIPKGDNLNSSKDSRENIKLPKFDLPKFSGDINEWLNFKDLFLTTIDKNSSLTPLEKLSYLQISCTHNASKLIKGFSIANENYLPAWETLVKRYDNKRELAFSQVVKLFSVKSIKSTKSIRELLDNSNEALRNLKTLGFEPNPMVELILVQFFQSKFDPSIKQQWEFSLDSGTIPELNKLIEFLEKQARSLQDSKEVSVKIENNKFTPKKSTVNNALVKNSPPKCILCNQNHLLFKCSEFIQMPLDQRWNFVKGQKLCNNCLRASHFSSRCLIDTNCKVCHKRHHSLLHTFKPQSLTTSGSVDQQPHINNSENSVQGNISLDSQCFASQTNDKTNVLLSTAIINVKNNFGKSVPCRALLDSGSQASMISRTCCKNLNLPVEVTNHSITGINDVVAETTLFKTKLKFTSCSGNSQFELMALVVNKVTSNLPNFTVLSNKWNHLENLTLADPKYNVPGPIDILIGADLYSEIIIGNPIIGSPGSPTALNTKLGWILSGKLFNASQNTSKLLTHHALLDLNEEIRRFWEIESIPSIQEESKENERCEALYCSTTKRDKSGRFVVNLPFKREPLLGESKGQAIRRFLYLEEKLTQNPELKTQYVKFMTEYKDLGHMQIIPKESTSNNLNQGYYMPHHGVLREQSETTKLRVVFDASAKSTSGESLNDYLLTGPKLQQDLFNILLRFRIHPVAVTADLEKMFRQIQVTPMHTEFQKIIWRENPNQSLEEYKLMTVTYGTGCAPYLAVRTIQQLAREEKSRFPSASKIALRDFYVDDLLSGAETIQKATSLVNEIQCLMQSGGFNLRKWSSNHDEVLKNLPQEMKATNDKIQINENKSTKILGLHWNSNEDTLQVQFPDFEEIASKRQLLSNIAKIFDPLGFLSPATILLKMMMQDLWKNELAWDDAVPSEIVKTWNKFKSEMNSLKNIAIPRHLKLTSPEVKNIQLHGFCDSSSKAYAAVLYLRVTLTSGEVIVRFVTAKSRVAPLKTITLPRLELCSALLLSRLYRSVSLSFDVFEEVLLWSDSEITLCWIKSDSSKDQFVKNRVAIINSLTEKASWHHISGSINPADCASRGVMPTKLENHPLWWNGPPWLCENYTDFHENSSEYSVNISACDNIFPNESANEAEECRTFIQRDNNAENCTIIDRYSSFSKLQRITALCLRFIYNCRVEQSKRRSDFLNSEELRDSTLRLVKIIQGSVFRTEINFLSNKKPLPRDNKYLSLSIFLDSFGFIRVGGRLKHSNLTWDTKHPLLIPKNHPFTRLLIKHFHLKYLHAGSELILNQIRQKFWIPSGRSQVKKIIQECHTCFRLKSKVIAPVMGNLPNARVNPTRAFHITGVDLAGPIITKPNVKRSKIKIKSYIALFICFATKAIHLEAVSDLSTASFLAALRRFVSRRGKPSEIHSDNASNFKGSKSYLNEQYTIFKSENVQSLAAEEQIKWHFIPPRAPHFGGLWESNIKSMKSLLIKTCKSKVLNFEELSTLLTQIEAILNSRPLTPMSSDPNDCSALTPGHFLVGSTLLAVPEPSVPQTSNLLEVWQSIQTLRAQFWKRWSKEYLLSLQNRRKWKTSKSDIHVGDLVLISDDSPPLQWPLARVTKLFPGDDGVTRVVELKTANGIFKRPVHKLCHLPHPGPEDVP